MKNARERLDILSAYTALGKLPGRRRALCDDPKTVRRVMERRHRPVTERPRRPRNTDALGELIAAKVRATDGRISAKRLLRICRAAGYEGSARSLLRAVAETKALHRRAPRVYWPWAPLPGAHLVLDWGLRLAAMSSARCSPGAGSASCASPPARAKPRRCVCSPSASRPSAGCPRWSSPTAWVA